MLSLDFRRLRAAYRNGATTPEKVVEEVLARIESAGDDHVWISRTNPAALRNRGRELTQMTSDQSSLPLYGLPFAVRDSLDVAGFPTTLACPAYSFIPQQSATVVDRLVRAGAIFVGKTNLDQFATGLVGVRSPYGTPRNPFDRTMIPGGSSSGSAVAVSSGLVSFAVATDTAGSGRVPASFCNIVGYKPTRGLFSMRGLTPACRSVDCVTLMGLMVGDVMEVSMAIAGLDPADLCSRRPPSGFAPKIGRRPANFRFGVPRSNQLEFFGDSEVASIFRDSIKRASALGGTPVEIDYSPWVECGGLLYGAWVAERSTDLGDFIESHRDQVDPVVRDIILDGQRISAVELFRAQHRLVELTRAIKPVWEEIDFLIAPTTGTAYSIEQVRADPVQLNTNLGYYTTSANLLDLAAIAIPAGFTSMHFPAGITLLGPAWSDPILAAYADALQRIADLPLGATGISVPEAQF